LAAEGLGLTVLQPESLRSPAAIAQIRGLSPDCIVAVAYGQILRQELIDIPPRGVVNLHPSLLPRYRGASPIASAILAGDETTGVTIMLMDAGMDTGPILLQRPHPIEPEDTTGTLSEKLSRFGAGLLAAALPLWLRGDISPEPQDDSQATTTSLLRKEDGRIDWTRTAAAIWRQVRACNPWPGSYTHFGGDQLHIWTAWPLNAESGSAPGTVVHLTQEQQANTPGAPPFAIQTGIGLLAVRELQRAGRRTLQAAEFLRGQPGFIGSQLN
jgi:methionyl-tRNA formyltransferase